MTPQAVAEWLIANPDFFDRHPETLLELRIPAPARGDTIPLIERQVLALKDQARQLNVAMARLMAYGESNGNIVAQAHRLAVGLLAARRVEDIIAAVRRSLEDDFQLRGWAIRLWHPKAEAFGLHAAPLPLAERTVAAPYGGHYLSQQAMDWLPGHHVWQSFGLAVLKTADGEPFGALVLASEDEQRFATDMETLLLADIAELIATALTRELDRA